MLINIKEIFKSDLDPNSENWWAKDKVDKLNWNFDKLSNGGAQGPIGFDGINGETGNRGFQGEQGTQGFQGFQGEKGIPGISAWRVNSMEITEDEDESNPTIINKLTILPNKMEGAEFSAPGIIIGKRFDDNLNSDYNKQLPYRDNGSTPSVFYSNNDRSNFGLDSNEVKVFAPHKYTTNTLTIGNTNSSDNLIIQNNLTNTKHEMYAGSSSETPVVELDSNVFKVNKPTIFNEPATINSLEYLPNAATNQVLIADGNTGKVKWKSKFELFGALPVGSIMSVSTQQFNDTNFHLNEDGVEVDASGVLANVFGRGKEGTAFEGWYLCNGETWQFPGIISHKVPDLNSFTYSISENPNGGQTSAGDTDDTPILIGGADIEMYANYENGGYNITMENSTDSDEFEIELQTGGATDSERTRMVHLINLGESSLVWKTIQSTITSINVELSPPSETEFIACGSTDTQTYKWIGDDFRPDWENYDDIPEGQLFLNNSPAPTNKYYKLAGKTFWRLWNGSEWGTPPNGANHCPALVTLDYNSSVIGLNGNANNNVDYLLSTDSLRTTTYIKNSNGTNAAAGWYREVDASGGVRQRVHWNGSSITFRDDSNYIHSAGKLYGSLTLGTGVCTAINTLIDVYYTSSSATEFTDIIPQLLYNSSTVLVNRAWQSNHPSDIGTFGLIKIKDQNAPGSGSTFLSLKDNKGSGSRYAQIQSNSKLTGLSQCAPYGTMLITAADNVTGNVIKYTSGFASTSANIVTVYADDTWTLSPSGGGISGVTYSPASGNATAQGTQVTMEYDGTTNTAKTVTWNLTVGGNIVSSFNVDMGILDIGPIDVKIICNELYKQGYLSEDLWDADERYGDMMFDKNPEPIIGYQIWARYVVRYIRNNPQHTKYVYLIVKPWTEYMGYEMGVLSKQNYIGKILHNIGYYPSILIYKMFGGKKILDYIKSKRDI